MKCNVNIPRGLTWKREMLFTVPVPRGPDPDLEIRGPRSSRPLDKWRGGRGVSKKTFSALRASVWSKNRGSRALRAPPGSATASVNHNWDLIERKPAQACLELYLTSVKGLERFKMESIRKLSNFDFQWTKIVYQNNLRRIALLKME